MKQAAVISKSLYLSKTWSKVILIKQNYLRPLKKIPHTRISNSRIKLHPKEIKW
jgi:uncharacterized protein (UPF0371 family)